MLSKTRDMEAAKRFFACALKTMGQAPKKVTTDDHDSYPRAVRETRPGPGRLRVQAPPTPARCGRPSAPTCVIGPVGP